MLEKLKQVGNAAKDAVTKTAIHLGDLNRDGKVDAEDAHIASEWAKKQAVSLGEEAARIGKEVARSDLGKDVTVHISAHRGRRFRLNVDAISA